MDNALDKARLKINEIDKKMAELFVERMRAAEEVADYKRRHGLRIFDAVREAEVINRNSAMVEDSTIREYYINFLKNNMAISRSYQDRILEGMKIAYCGTEGAFAHIAAKRVFPTARKIPYPDFGAAYRAVEDGECDACVLPVENSYNGEVGQVTDLMFSGSLFVSGTTELQVSQDLVALPGVTLADVKEVVSHPQALGQCAEYIKRHGFETKEYSNTALAAKYVSEKGDKTLAAIASSEAAEIFGLVPIEKNINESRTNTTKFVILSRTKTEIKREDMRLHSILLFTVKHEAGALAKAIEIIGKYGFNMRALRSRPMKELLWQYYFYIEAEGNIDGENGKKMLSELEKYCDRLKALGTYIKE